jgi:hypothetical protein
MTVWKVLRKKLTMKPCPRDVAEVKERIREATATVDEAMLGRVRQEFDYRVDVCRVTHGSTSKVYEVKTNFQSFSSK